MVGTEAAGHDPDAATIQIQGARQSDRIGRHRVRMPVMHDHAHRTDAHRNPQRQIHPEDLQRPQPRALLADPLSDATVVRGLRTGGLLIPKRP